MKTIVIWDLIGDPICFFVLEGDYSRLDRKYLGVTPEDDAEEVLLDELQQIVYNGGDEPVVDMMDHFPISIIEEDEIGGQVHVITCGEEP